MIKRSIIFSYNKGALIQHLPYFKIHKCPKDFPQPPMEYGHHPYFLDFQITEVEQTMGVTEYSYNLSEKPQFDDFQKFPLPKSALQNDHNSKIQNEILNLVNCLSNEHFFIYGTRQSWAISLDETRKPSYSQEGYLPPNFDHEIDKIEAQSNYEFLDPILFTLRGDANDLKKVVRMGDLLKLYYSSKNLEIKDKYLNACIVFNKALSLASTDQSAAFIFMASAIETLVELEFKYEKPKKCSCGEVTNYRVRGKFRDFIEKYGYKIDKKTKDGFYDMRCDILHLGKLFQSGYLGKFFVENQEDFNKRHQSTIENIKYTEFMNLVKTCFRTFIYENIKK